MAFLREDELEKGRWCSLHTTGFSFVESQKEIQEIFEQKLWEECSDLYEILRNKSLGG